MAVFKAVEGFTYSGLAGADLRTSLNRFCTVQPDERIVLPAAGAACIGTIFEAGNTNEPVSVQTGGIAKVVLAATLSAGAEVQSDANGAAVAFTSGRKCGQLLKGGVSGNVVPCKLAGV